MMLFSFLKLDLLRNSNGHFIIVALGFTEELIDNASIFKLNSEIMKKELIHNRFTFKKAVTFE